MKVTERNCANIMGHINKFFKKDTKIFLGEKRVVDGYETELFGDTEINVPIYVTKDVYDPYVGKCEFHWLKGQSQEATHYSKSMKRIIKTPLLFIRTSYSESGIPIFEGDDVRITGDRMVIKDNYYIGYIHKNPIYREFYHMPITEEERLETVRDGVYSAFDRTDQSDIDYTDEDCLYHAIYRDLQMSAYDIIESIDLSSDVVRKKLWYETSRTVDNIDVIMYINISDIRNSNDINLVKDDVIFYLFKDKKYTDVIELAEAVFLDQYPDYFGSEDDESEDYLCGILN